MEGSELVVGGSILYLHSWWSSSTATCTCGVFPWSTSAFTNVLTNEYAQIAICTVWWWWWWWLYMDVMVIHVCGGVNV